MDKMDASVVVRKPSLTPSGWFGNGKEMIVELEINEKEL